MLLFNERPHLHVPYLSVPHCLDPLGHYLCLVSTKLLLAPLEQLTLIHATLQSNTFGLLPPGLHLCFECRAYLPFPVQLESPLSLDRSGVLVRLEASDVRPVLELGRAGERGVRAQVRNTEDLVVEGQAHFDAQERGKGVVLVGRVEIKVEEERRGGTVQA